jgi:hypothetical protein
MVNSKKRFWYVATGVAIVSMVMAQGGGPIRQIIAESGLFGGGSSGTVRVGIAEGGVTSSHIQDGTIAMGDLSTDLQGSIGSGGGIQPTVINDQIPGQELAPNVPNIYHIREFTLNQESVVHVHSHGQLKFDHTISPAGSFVTSAEDELALFRTEGSAQTFLARKQAYWGPLSTNNFFGNSDHTIVRVLQPGTYFARYIVSYGGGAGMLYFYRGSVDVEIIPIG